MRNANLTLLTLVQDECLNEQWFEMLHQTRTAVSIWHADDNEMRPHSNLGRIPAAMPPDSH